MKEQLEALEKRVRRAVEEADAVEKLAELKIGFLGKKGEITQLSRLMGSLSAEERPAMGQMVNQVKQQAEALIEEKMAYLQQQAQQLRLRAERIDITLPGRPVNTGARHIITSVQQQIEDIFIGLGYQVVEGPQVETDYYNFEAMNIPRDHPARDMQDSFYFSPQMLLRTHTSPVQARIMEKMQGKLPVKIISPGAVYRRDEDATHTPMFHQVEALLVDERVTFADLSGTLLAFARQMFGEERQIRMRPSYFPFTEPSAEVDISCFACGGEGCRLCKGSGWIEILGSGMVHPRVLEMSGYDPKHCSGFAFGMGIERIAMLKYGINDLRLLFDNDVRFLSSFWGGQK
ncbi:MAG: phenylalanine--tRNA ligase subunit alpha [Bacillota bacterium]|nr:phenylalanine--tRNA ligase subunit alpha [Bacillota bacterium]